MRIAAGVLLIIVGIFNGIAGMGYAAAGGAGVVAEEAAKEAAKQQGSQLTEEQKKALNEAASVATGGMGIFGIFLLVMLGLQIAGAVTLFMQKAAKFVMVVGILGIIAEVTGVAAFGVAFGVTNILGIVASVLALLAAKGYMGKTA
ncbi:MAG: hypothetical protein R3F60_16970 [bacterium]